MMRIRLRTCPRHVTSARSVSMMMVIVATMHVALHIIKCCLRYLKMYSNLSKHFRYVLLCSASIELLKSVHIDTKHVVVSGRGWGGFVCGIDAIKSQRMLKNPASPLDLRAGRASVGRLEGVSGLRCKATMHHSLMLISKPHHDINV